MRCRARARAAFAASSAAPDEPCEVTLVLTDDDEMRELNRTWRGKDASTNVLSFPAGGPFGEAHGEPAPLGDIVLAGETVIEEAKLKGHPGSPITPPILSCTACCISWVSTMSATQTLSAWKRSRRRSSPGSASPTPMPRMRSRSPRR